MPFLSTGIAHFLANHSICRESKLAASFWVLIVNAAWVWHRKTHCYCFSLCLLLLLSSGQRRPVHLWLCPLVAPGQTQIIGGRKRLGWCCSLRRAPPALCCTCSPSAPISKKAKSHVLSSPGSRKLAVLIWWNDSRKSSQYVMLHHCTHKGRT